MCGIAGIFNYENRGKVEEEVLATMRDSMFHRGPDGAGMWISPDRSVGLGHRRLSIVDLSESANQPMCNEDGRIWIVFNGEIYNHIEIRAELESQGHRFSTDHSDTEVIIHAYEQWGKDCVHKFRGMFAFAIWDDIKKELLLFRDRIGIKPLYYTFRKGQFIFASEIKAILTHKEIPREVDEEAFYHYLSFMTSPAPLTLFKGIRKLPFGSYLRVTRNGEAETGRYWDVLDHTKPLSGLSEEEISSRLLEELKASVSCRKMSDVPVGVFLSGGIDSSANAALFSETQSDPIKTFSIGYKGNYESYQNEFKYAQIMANLVGADHYEKELTTDELIDFLPELAFYQDEPISDPVCLPVYYVSKLARDNGVVVCQVGEGSDELFCGYPGWMRILRLQRLSELPFAGALSRLGLGTLKLMNKANAFPYERLRRGVCGEPLFWGGAESFTEWEKKKLLCSRLRNKFNGYSSFEVLKPIEKRFKEKAWEPSALNWMSYVDLNFRLPELLLMRVDKMSMATSLEARVPFLDHKFVELSMSIPQSTKIKHGNLKHILKKAVTGLIPDELIHRKKQGFGVPLQELFFEKLGSYSHEKITGFINRTDFFDKDYIGGLLSRRESGKLWYILNFVLWHERWIEGI
ncbi:asparagine synthase (glutamine-hydrolyzing) [Planctomycetota bacterium]